MPAIISNISFRSDVWARLEADRGEYPRSAYIRRLIMGSSAHVANPAPVKPTTLNEGNLDLTKLTAPCRKLVGDAMKQGQTIEEVVQLLYTVAEKANEALEASREDDRG